MKYGGYDIVDLGPEHNAEILELLTQCPIDTGYVSLVFDRQPDFFLLPGLKYDGFLYKGCMVDGKLKGVFLMAWHNAYVHGILQKVYYLGNAFIVPEMRRKAFIANAGAEFFDKLDPDLRIGYSLIMKKNVRAENYIGKKSPDYPQLPDSRSIADFVGRSIPLLMPKKYKGELEIRNATWSDLSYLSECLDAKAKTQSFGEIYTPERLERIIKERPGFEITNFRIAFKHGEPVGFCSAWDTGQIRQTRVLQFGNKFKPLVYTYRLLSPLFTAPPLPKAGGAFREVHVGHVVINDDNPDVFQALLTHIYEEARRAKIHFMLWGSYAGDPLLAAIRKFRGLELHSNIVIVGRDKEVLQASYPAPYIDTAFL
jgi:hypothetical protein